LHTGVDTAARARIRTRELGQVTGTHAGNAFRAGEQLRRGANLVEGVDDVPPYFDMFAEYKEFCVQYRAKLSQIVRATAGWLPEQASP
jgi:hypothetical protein